MFWLRWIFFSSPLLLGLGGFWLFGKVAALRLEFESDAFVHAIGEPVGRLDPLAPADGIDGEIAGLLFEPLLRRDEDLNLRPNLLASWSYRSVLTLRCESEEAAGEAEARMRAGEAPLRGPKPLAVDREGSVLTVAFDGADEDFEAPLLESLPGELLADFTLVRVVADHSIEPLVATWMESSLEKRRVRMLEFVGEVGADLFVEGEAEPLLEEMRLFFGSNAATRPRAEVVGKRCHTTSREMLLDLLPGVLWHDGEPFTAEDVLFSFQLLAGPGSPLPLTSHFDFVVSLAATGPHRLRVVCREVPATTLESWEKLPLLPSHVFAGASGEEIRARFEDLSLQPVGLGPYRLEQRRADGGVELRAHDAYHLGTPRETLVRFRRLASLESVLLAVRRGTLQAIEPDARFREWVDRHPGLTETVRDVPRFQHQVVWNLERAPLDRAPVRLALARGIDLRAILEEGASRYEAPVTSLFHPGLPFVAEPLLLPLLDPKGAEKLLEKEGFRLDPGSGERRDAQGKVLAFSLAVNEGNAAHLRLAAGLVEQWAAIGVRAEVEPLPWAELLTRRLPERAFDAVLLSWEIPLGRDQREVWHSRAAGPGGGNLSGLRDPAVDALLEELRSESDPAKVAVAAAALQRAIAAAQPCLFLCDSGRIATLRAGAVGVMSPGAAEPVPLVLGKGGLAASRPWWVRRPRSKP